MNIRTSAKALIIEDGHILLVKMKDERGIFYIMPGGGQNHGETIPEALQRECQEELGTAVEIGPLFFVREYIGKNHENAQLHTEIHQVEFIFSCRAISDPGSPIHPDQGQIGAEWLPLHELASYRLYPKQIVPILSAVLTSRQEDDEAIPAYIGDMN
ncbi:NUDIX domain-containing protein [Aneurinibacillus sp. REN35]|uniref:NUDIX domain-containing protein n=1 Tax=Aneurinibacillus sp. REN35 TaxID=3237286 RepID=UPI0035272B8D